MDTENITFSVETSRILEIISTQIYQSPLALLRENVQNAFDAILMRLAHREQGYKPEINIEIEPGKLTVSDNGIGMTRYVIENNFWKAGSSGKNTAEARAAGVVGTFGIGALANFGIAEELIVETESMEDNYRIKSFARKDELDINTKCIKVETLPSQGKYGTTISAILPTGKNLNVEEAKAYVAQFVSLLRFPVSINGDVISLKNATELVAQPASSWIVNERNVVFSSLLTADIKIIFSKISEVWLEINNLIWNGNEISGYIIYKSNGGPIRTFRSGFGLADAPISTVFSFGGIVDLNNLKPTAGREALTTDSLNFIQALSGPVEKYVCEKLADRSECDSSIPFMQWVLNNNRYDLCKNLKMRIEPGDKILLSDVVTKTEKKTYHTYRGNDQEIIRTFSGEDNPLLIHATTNPRFNCEQQYLMKYCKTKKISNSPKILSIREDSELSLAEGALKFRLNMILEDDYFLNSCIQYGKISHNLPILVEHDQGNTKITLDVAANVIGFMLEIYGKEYSVFTSYVKDFVRTALFDKISQYMPSSTRQGAEAFIKTIKKKHEIFEIDEGETDIIASIWDDYSSGIISMSEAIDKVAVAPRKSVQTVDKAVSARVVDEIPDIIQNVEQLKNSQIQPQNSDGAVGPPILRIDTPTTAKLLTIEEGETPLHGYHTFLSITDKARNEYGEFFQHPHKTSCVWGGQRVLFIFMHHSGQYGLYYDIQMPHPIDVASGGGIITATLILKNRIFIPIPDVIKDNFIPKHGDKKRFNIRYDLLRADSQ